jgi:hypothetical protein
MKILAPIIALLLAACTVNPLKTANTATADNKPETIAFATFGMFVITEEAAATLKETPGTPQSVKDALKRADALASPAAEEIQTAAKAVSAARAAIAAGKADPSTLPVQLAKMNALLTADAPKLQALVSAYSAAKGAKTP